MDQLRDSLRDSAAKIAGRRGENPAGRLTAIRKLFVQEKRRAGVFVGWKRGEIFEVAMAATPEERAEEIGDMGYYIAQSFDFLWALYALLTPAPIIEAAAVKFARRAERPQQ